MRTFQQRTVLEIFGGRIVAVSLSGYIFFGSSVKIGDNVSAVRHKCLTCSRMKKSPRKPGFTRELISSMTLCIFVVMREVFCLTLVSMRA